MITLSGAGAAKEGGGGRGGKQAAQSLCQWAEVAGHPGLVSAVMQASNNPVVLMLTPTNIFVQEIKVTRTFVLFVTAYIVSVDNVINNSKFIQILNSGTGIQNFNKITLK